jgi:uncharacterized membrane protein YgcG
MLKLSFCLLAAVLSWNFVALAQVSAPPTDQKPKDLPVVTKMMAYGKKQEGKVWREEVTDERLLRLFDLADTKKEGVVTKEQLVTAATKLEAEQPPGGRRGGEDGGGPGGGRGRGGFGGGPGGFGGGGRRAGFGGGSGRGGFGGGPGEDPGGNRGGSGGVLGGRPQMGVVMPNFVQDELGLSETQKKEVAELQKELDAKLNKILTDDQKKKYQEMKENPGRGGPNGRGPGGRGGPGGPGGRGGPPSE